MAKFDHAYTIAFSLVSDDEQGKDVTTAMLKEALLRRIKDLDQSPQGGEWFEAVGAPFDTHEVEE